MKKTLIASGLLAATCAAGFIVHAQPPAGSPAGGGRHGMFFDMLDANKDGTITREEALAAASKKFDAIDTNHDGVITQAERDAARTRMIDERFKQMDTNGDGQISREEFRAAHEKMREAMKDHEGPGRGRGPRGGGMGMGWGGGPGMQGDIKKTDVLARVGAMFDRIDTNHDGKITPEERAAAREHMKQMRGRGGPGRPGGPGNPGAPNQPAG
jgi:Ca2+-binding EF-hand superfamily protein